jgi:hypothetical protein
MNSHLPYTNRLVYLIQTKLGLELPEDIIHDIRWTLYDYSAETTKTYQQERDYWRNHSLKKVH